MNIRPKIYNKGWNLFKCAFKNFLFIASSEAENPYFKWIIPNTDHVLFSQ